MFRKLCGVHRFNSQPPEGGWDRQVKTALKLIAFQLTAARRRLDALLVRFFPYRSFQLTAARRRLGEPGDLSDSIQRFNSQPPEGGWQIRIVTRFIFLRFNSQPPEGGWGWYMWHSVMDSRFNSQPPEGGWRYGRFEACKRPRFNSQPPEGGWRLR